MKDLIPVRKTSPGASRLGCLACDYCGKPAERVTGRIIYPHRPDLYHKQFIRCAPCDAMVGCHADGRPLGRLANAELRRAKMAAHAAFDPLWKSGDISRGAAYAWLREALGIPKEECHIGMMDLSGCAAVVAACQARSAPEPSAAKGSPSNPLESSPLGDRAP